MSVPPKQEQDLDDDGDQQNSIGLDELEAAPPDQNADDAQVYRWTSLEERRSKDRSASHRAGSAPTPTKSRVWASFCIHSYLTLFSILGVLARLGLVALTTYPGAPLSTTVVWANVAGSLVMGFLREERMLFRRHWKEALKETREAVQISGSGYEGTQKEATTKAYVACRSANYAFIGLTVGFCGSLTSFADIIRDALLALFNDLNTAPISSQVTEQLSARRLPGYSALAVIAVVWIEVSMSLGALALGGHLGIATHRMTDCLPAVRLERVLSPIVVVVAWGAWLGAVLMAIWPPTDEWRGQAVLAVVFAPLGAMLRFHLARQLNPKVASFPLGTFAANIGGTCILGMIWDLQHSQVARLIIPCQVLQGVGDGFCGALTTVSTWVLELMSLRLKHAYIYGMTSLVIACACMLTIMGPLRWTTGFRVSACGS